MTGFPISIEDPKHYSAAVNGRVFMATTPATGVAPGTSLGSTAPFALANLGEWLDLIILEARLSYVSGTFGAGTVYWASVPGGVASGTELAIRNALLGTELPAAVQSALAVRAYSPATIAPPTAMRPLCSLGASLATTEAGAWAIRDDVDGAIIVPPGEAIAIGAVAGAGSSPLVQISVTWTVRPAVPEVV